MERLRNVCDCGTGGFFELRHWEVGRCGCGRFFWALEPKRGGPLVLYAWAGDPASNRASGAWPEKREGG